MAEMMEGGTVKIADDVVAVIAGIAALDTEGIASMSGGITEGIARYVSGKNVQKGVTVEVGQVEAAIDLRVIVYYGVKIDEACRQLQVNVKEAIENMTGLQVVEVNVKVEGVQFRKDDEIAIVEEEPKVR
ncbi:Asp23/Gls24 family envelope stress response protein [Rubeoparvulum massiliense]|uniref:Asp23/Gls24 family envelope stress response protein n=1 Tax=Rubeoparvulum massiliense TaxID=1631346 RepID=UPI00065E5B48|nr:Asp23/Gls24 family envelope stress response protein [Rubeoparvulum massiliense]